MDNGGGPAPPRGQVHLPEWKRAYEHLKKMLLQAHSLAEELSVEREHLITELEFERMGRSEREEIFNLRFQQIWRNEERCKRVEKAEEAVLVADKDLHVGCYKTLLELTQDDMDDFKSCIFNLANENAELKARLEKAENQALLSEDNLDHQHSAKDLRAEIRKLKKAYRSMNSEKDKVISELESGKKFVWNQFQTMEQEYRTAIKNKSIEAAKLQKDFDELQVVAQKKDDQIIRLQVEVSSAKERMLVLEDELQQIRSLVQDKDAETDGNKSDRPKTSQKLKKGIHETNRKSKSERSALYDKSRTPQLTPDRREVKTSRTRVSEASQKRKRSSTMSCGSRRCSTRPLQTKAALSPSPMLLPPGFTVPRLRTPTPPKPDETPCSAV